MSSTTSLGLIFKYVPTTYGMYQTGFNVRHELDKYAAPYGVSRFTQEGIGDYALRFRRAQLKAGDDSFSGMAYQLNMALGEEPAYLCIEHTATNFIPLVLVEDHQLVFRKVTRTSTTTSTYDLLPSSTFHSLEDVAARITAQESGFLAYIEPWTKDRRDLLPAGLLNGQVNYQSKSFMIPDSTTFKISYQPLIPSHFKPGPSLSNWVEKTASALVTETNSYYVDYQNGRMAIYNPPSPNSYVIYSEADKVSRFAAVPSVSLNLANIDVLDRYAASTNTPAYIYYTSSSGTATSTDKTPGFAFDPRINRAIQQGVIYLHERWGE